MSDSSNTAKLTELFQDWMDKKAAVIPDPKEKPKNTLGGNDYDYDADTEPYVPFGVGGILASTEKLLAVNRGLEDVDDRDSLVFKKIFLPDAQFSERIRTDITGGRKRILRMAAHRRNLSPLGPLAFDDYTEKQLTGNPLASPLEEINPIQLVESARRITQMGPGGIRSSDAITSGMQAINTSQFGFISGLEGPESERAGIDVRMTWGTKYGSDGRIYQLFRNKRTGKLEYKNPYDLDGKIVKLPE